MQHNITITHALSHRIAYHWESTPQLQTFVNIICFEDQFGLAILFCHCFLIFDISSDIFCGSLRVAFW